MKEVKNYLNNRFINEMALLIDGKWGHGKTFYIRNFAENEKERASISQVFYVSLNGITSLNSIDEQILAQKLKIDTKIGKIAAGTVRALARIAIRNNGQAEAKAGDFGDLSWNDIVTYKDALFIIDDLERCPVNIDKILGYVNSNYLQDSSNRVIYICNEAEIHDDQKETYRLVKEKYIGWTVYFRPDFRSAARAIFAKYPNLIDKMDIDATLTWCEELEAFNLRTFSFYLNTLSVVIHLLPKDDYSRAIFNYSMLVVCTHYKDGIIESGVQVKDLPAYLNPTKVREHPANSVAGPTNPTITNKIRLLYNNPNIAHVDSPLTFTVSQQLLDLVTSLKYDPDKFKIHITKLEQTYSNRFLTENIKKAKKLYRFEYLKAGEYKMIRDQLLTAIQDNTMDVIDLIAVMKVFLSLSSNGAEFTGISQQDYEGLKNLISADDYKFFLADGDQRGVEYEFFVNVCDIVPFGYPDPLYIKFKCFFEQYQEIKDDLSPPNHDWAASPILNISGRWKENITEYLIAFDNDYFISLLEMHQENHTFWINLDRYFDSLDLTHLCDDDKSTIHSIAKAIEKHAGSELAGAELSEKLLFTRLSNCSRGVSFT